MMGWVIKYKCKHTVLGSSAEDYTKADVHQQHYCATKTAAFYCSQGIAIDSAHQCLRSLTALSTRHNRLPRRSESKARHALPTATFHTYVVLCLIAVESLPCRCHVLLIMHEVVEGGDCCNLAVHGIGGKHV